MTIIIKCKTIIGRCDAVRRLLEKKKKLVRSEVKAPIGPLLQTMFNKSVSIGRPAPEARRGVNGRNRECAGVGETLTVTECLSR
ncbi:hypothetical protein EVAR_3596_1 [Eumeta japonica]|uniref:Uncharacterized protein n=1 Tax=Eumeta variegata TaxID=151549 RepID=A0A4C1SWE5_EUMVA|nr:hypothetical protein EVAR_3596_1 [Eumeta japonica]